MWLPKDERRLLQGYYLKIGEVETEVWFDDIIRWRRVMKSKPSKIKDSIDKIKDYYSGGISVESKPGSSIPEQIQQLISDKTRLDIANKALEQRGLIKIHNHQSEPNMTAITLTISGYDLGRKYNSWLTRSHLWFAEYKHHWIWIIVGFLGGVMGAILVNWLSSFFGAKRT